LENITETEHVKLNKGSATTEGKEVPVAQEINCFRRSVENSLIRV